MSVNILSILELAPPYYVVLSSGSLDLYSYGKATITSNLDLYSSGGLLSNGSLNLYSVAKASSTQGLNLVCTGAYPTINSGLNLICEGFSYINTSSLNMSTYVSNVGSSNNGMNVFTRVAEGGSLSCYSQGPGNPKNGSIQLYTSGSIGMTGSLTMATTITKANQTGSLTIYSRGW